MNYPNEIARKNRRELHDALVTEFRNARTFEEFCVLVSTKYGVRITKLSKWFLAYKCIDFGDMKSRMLLMIGICIIILSLAGLADYFHLDKGSIGLCTIMLGCGTAFAYMLVKFVKFCSLLDDINASDDI